MNGKQTEKAEKIIGYAFKNKTLLERAFIHSSYANENNVESYERLEFLGDGVLGLIVAELLYEGSGDEGVMTVRRSRIVSSGPLEDATEKMGLDEFIQYGKGDARRTIRTQSPRRRIRSRARRDLSRRRIRTRRRIRDPSSRRRDKPRSIFAADKS